MLVFVIYLKVFASALLRHYKNYIQLFVTCLK